ncbi:MAG: hypothetical protein QE263_04350 [Vampirovibrionales bacterium]|nr:hypothetical protein [Vampirovibrionales bacterium]
MKSKNSSLTEKVHTIVWAFSVAPQHQAEFERAYGSVGDWAQLFIRQTGYLGTRLYRDISSREDGLLHYLCEDVWDNQTSHKAFLAEHQDDYLALDARCEAFTVSERRLLQA